MGRRRYQVEREPEQGVRRRAATKERSEHPVLALQRSAGNQAVAERLELARQDIEGDAGTAVQEAEGAKSGATLTLEGDVALSMSISSYSWGVSGAGGKSSAKDVVITAQMDENEPLIMKAAASGKKIDRAVIAARGLTITLKDVYVTSVQTGGGAADNPTYSFTLSFATAEYEHPEK